MRLRKGFAQVLATALGLALLVGCSGGTKPTVSSDSGTKPTVSGDSGTKSPETAKGPVTSIIAVQSDFKTFDPGHAYEIYASPVVHAMYDTLVLQEDGKIVPHVAKSWEVKDGGKTIEISLRDDVKFSSGNKLTADDVKFTFLRLKYMKGNPSFLAEGIDSIAVVGPQSLKISLKAPDSAFLSKIAVQFLGILDSKVLKAQGGTDAADADKTDKAQAWLDKNSAGSGPYVLKEFTPKQQVVLEKNPNYWGTAPAIDKFVFKDVADANTQMLTIQKGDVDFALNLSGDQVKEMESVKGVTLVKGTTLDIFFILFNQDPAIGGPMANPKVQKAVRLALDYEGLRTLIGMNVSTPFSIIPQGMLGAKPANQAKTDLEAAKALLKDAGFASGFTTKFEYPTLTLDGIDFAVVAQKVQEDLGKIGIKLELVPQDITVDLDRYRQAQQPVALMIWGPDYPDANSQLAFLPGEVVGLRVNWKAEADAALAQLGKSAITEMDQAKRADILGKVQEQMNDHGPFVVYAQPGRVIAVRDNLKGVTLNPYFLLDLAKISK